MIRRPRELVNCPVVLGPVGTKAARERIKAQTHYGAAVPPTKNIKFSAYSEDEVKEKLEQLFGCKCAYCEGDYAATGPVDVEHYRPKGGVMFEGELRFPGYWWLASTWTNLLPSCTDCNRGRWHKTGNGEHKHGKENLFPLADGAMPATNAAAALLEHPLLLDPAVDEPSGHFSFLVEETPGGKRESIAKPHLLADASEDARGDASINTYALNRPRLARSRLRRVMELEAALAEIEDRLIEAKTEPQKKDHHLAKARTKVRTVTRMYLHWSCPYAAACRAFYRNWREGLQTLT